MTTYYRRSYHDMDSFIDPVHDAAFTHCIKRLAGTVGMSTKSLYRRLDDNDAMPLRFIDAVAIFWAVDDASRRRILQPFLDDLGLRVVRDVTALGHITPLDRVTDLQLLTGTVTTLVRDDLAAGRIEGRERAELSEALREEIEGLSRLMGELDEVAAPRLAQA